MAILNFTLSPESIGRLHDALACIGKFSEAVSIQASHDKLVLTALNSSKSAYCAFTLVGNKFFVRYQYSPARSGSTAEEKFNCKIYNKALLSIFKGRAVDPTREKETAVEKCDVSIEDGEGKARSRFIIKLMCRHGVMKTYRLTFESVPPVHALFVKESANNCWSISSTALREFVEHFGPGTEQLEIFSADGKVNFTSYTDKVISGNEILKQPLRTTIAVDTLEFGEFSVEENLRIVVSVKDFRSVAAHASATNTMVKALYSRPSSPMQLSYNDGGVLSEFIFMTIGEARGASATPTPNASRAGSKRPPSRQPLEAAFGPKRTATSMPPPPMSAAPSISRASNKLKAPRPSPPPPQSNFQSTALFVPADDDDEKWEPVNFDDNDDDEMLLWDQGEEKAKKAPVSIDFQANGLQNVASQAPANTRQIAGDRAALRPPDDSELLPTQRLAPTQQLSKIKGIFD